MWLSIISHGSISAIDATEIVLSNHTQDKCKGAEKMEIHQGTRYPLFAQGFYGSPKSRQKLRGVP
jgi:hypothetical protein